jgi:hypothetical protein
VVAGDQNAPGMDGRRRSPLAPLWVYFFGLFGVAFLQRWLFPPDEHSVTFNVLLFAGLAASVVAVLTILERTVRR